MFRYRVMWNRLDTIRIQRQGLIFKYVAPKLNRARRHFHFWWVDGESSIAQPKQNLPHLKGLQIANRNIYKYRQNRKKRNLYLTPPKIFSIQRVSQSPPLASPKGRRLYWYWLKGWKKEVYFFDSSSRGIWFRFNRVNHLVFPKYWKAISKVGIGLN